VNIERGEVGQGAAAGVLELDPAGPSGGGRQIVVASEGLELGLLVGADDVLVGPQPVALPQSLIEVEHSFGLGCEVRVSGKDPGLMQPRLDRIGV
jgi:hypothetical protein